MAGLGDTRYVPWAEGGNGGGRQPSDGVGGLGRGVGFEGLVGGVAGPPGRGEKGKQGKKRKREKEGGTFRVQGELLFRTLEEADAHLRAALEERDDGHDRDDGDDEAAEVGDKGEGGDKGGEVGGDKGVRRKGTPGERRGVPGARMRPGNPPPRRRGSLRVATRERGPGGQGG